MGPAAEPFLNAIREPENLAALAPQQWRRVLRIARRTALHPRVGEFVEKAGIAERLPLRVDEQLRAARLLAQHHHRLLGWELGRIRRALAGTTIPRVLLKGAAYVAADLPAAQGRLADDVDLLVPRESLGEVERLLRQWGWEPLSADEYDDHYYRAWMHELPPLRHRERGTVLDVHHTILPPTGRVHPDPALLFQASRPIGDSGYRMLAPEDMWLHCAAHLFQDSDLSGGLRDLIDLDLMLRHFGATEPGFWERLAPRAEQLQLTGPLHYALRYTVGWLNTPVPEAVRRQASRVRSGGIGGWLMDPLARQALAPEVGDGESWSGSMARRLLYLRAHWLRMPPGLLLRHLTRKAFRAARKRRT